jgi:hypothetical protein
MSGAYSAHAGHSKSAYSISETVELGFPCVQSVEVIAGTVVATKFGFAVLDEFAFDDEFDDTAPAIMAPAVTSTIKPTMNHAVVLLDSDEFAIIPLYYTVADKVNI